MRLHKKSHKGDGTPYAPKTYVEHGPLGSYSLFGKTYYPGGVRRLRFHRK
jgi:hypothetical protein